MIEDLSGRSEILARIRSVTGRDALSQTPENTWQAIPRSYRQTSVLDRTSCINLLVERLQDYGAGVFHSETTQLADTIAEILRHRNMKRMLVSPDIDPVWLRDDDDNDSCTFIADDELSYDAIDGCDGVLTGCAVSIATTGTLVLCHAPNSRQSAGAELGQARRVLTLIPDYHLCLVQASDVVETVPEAMRALDPHKKQPITLISGPSATADIEMTRIQGVHGPRMLDVVIVT